MPWQECVYCGAPFRPSGRGQGSVGARYCGQWCRDRGWKLEAVEAGRRPSSASLGDWEVEARAARYRRMAEAARRNPELPLALLCERFGLSEEEAEAAKYYLWHMGLHFPADYRVADVPAP